MADDADGKLTQFMVFLVCQRLGRSNHDGLAGVDTQRVEVLHVADRDTVVVTVTHHFILDFLPTAERFLHQYLGRERESLLYQYVQFFLIVAEAGAQTSQCIGCTYDNGITQLTGCTTCILGILHRLALDGLHLDLVQFLHKKLAVFRVDDSLYGSTQHAHIVFLQNATLIKLHTAVQGRLAAKGEEDTVGTFLLDDFLHKERSDRQEVNLVCHTFTGLHRRNVRIDQHRVDAFFFQSLQRL